MRPQLAAGRFVGHHLGGIARRDADPLLGGQDIELFGLQEQASAAVAADGLPEIQRRIVSDLRQVDDVAVLLGAVADDRLRPTLGAQQVDPQKEPLVRAQVAGGDGVPRGFIVKEQGSGFVEGSNVVVPNGRRALNESELVEALPGLHLDGERAGHDFEVERARIAGADVVEAGVPIRNHAREDVQTAGRALGVGPGPQRRRELQAFQQWHQIDVPLFQNGPVPQVHLVHHQVRLIKVEDVQLAGDVRPLGQEAAQQAVGLGPQAQIQAGWLDLPRLDALVGGDDATIDQSLQLLVGEDAALSACFLAHGSS